MYKQETERIALAKYIAEESIVLLKNETGLLPLKKGGTAAVFGRAQLKTYIGGSGSGASRNVKNPTNVLDELVRAGLCPSAKLADFYRETLAQEQEVDPFAELMKGGVDLVASGVIYDIFGKYVPPEEETDIGEALIQEAAEETDTAIFVLGRCSGGEECDRHVQDDYYLLPSEQKLIRQVCGTFAHVVLVLNINGVVDIGWISKYPSIQSVLFLGTAGEQGAAALADILMGTVTPSGKLCATFAPSYEAYPNAMDFSSVKEDPDSILEYKDYGLDAEANGSTGFEKSPVTVYREGMYVGYRYFDSFEKAVVFPFGCGESYAAFHMSELVIQKDSAKSGHMLVNCKITNSSDRFSGKEVAQVYLSAPQGALEQPYQSLIAFEKTKLLKPGESQKLCMEIPFVQLASYDEKQAAYVLEAGQYRIRVGNSSRNTRIAGSFVVKETIVTEQLENRLGLQACNEEKIEWLTQTGNAAKYMDAEGSVDFVLESEDFTGNDELAGTSSNPEGRTEQLSAASEAVHTLDEVKAGHISMKDFLAQMTIEELAVLCNGYGPGLPFGGFGTKNPPTISYEDGTPIAVSTHPSGNMGYVSPALLKYGISSAFYKDGPSSVGMTAWPTGMILSCCFNKELYYEFGNACAAEAESQQVSSWLAPGMNLQRNPIGGRNFEYFSEDPYLNGVCGVQICRGAEENHPVTTCPKHFALNEQETYRRGSTRKGFDAVDSIVQERVARELYLKPFEMILKNTKTCSLMTSFNKINGTFAAGNADLCTHILRDEWGYEGVVVTDWGDMDIVVDGADAVAAGNDVVMPGGPPVIAQVLDGYKEGRVSREQMERAAGHLLNFIMKTVG